MMSALQFEEEGGGINILSFLRNPFNDGKLSSWPFSVFEFLHKYSIGLRSGDNQHSSVFFGL